MCSKLAKMLNLESSMSTKHDRKLGLSLKLHASKDEKKEQRPSKFEEKRGIYQSKQKRKTKRHGKQTKKYAGYGT